MVLKFAVGVEKQLALKQASASAVKTGVREHAAAKKASSRAPPSKPPRVPGSRGPGPTPQRLVVRLQFEGEVHGVARVTSVLTAIERCIREFHEEELALAAAALEEELAAENQRIAAGLIGQEAQRWLRSSSVRANSQSRIERAATGSLIVELGVVGGVSYWVLEKTLGASFSEAWKKSAAGQRVTNWLKDLLDREFVVNRAARLQKKLQSQLRFGTIDLRSLSKHDQSGVIELLLRDRRPPSLAESDGRGGK